MSSIYHLTSFQPVEGKTFVVLTDLTAEGGLSPLAADTFKYLLGLNAGTVIAVPARLNTDFSTKEARIKLSSAFVKSLQDSPQSDLQKVVITSFQDLGSNVLPGIFSTATIGDSTVFVNDTFAAHPTAVALRKNWSNSVLEVQGKAFSATHNQVWPLTNKTVLVVTDAESENEQALALSTVRQLIDNGAASVHVAVTSATPATASSIASALKVTVEAQPPVRADSPLWNRQVSVSNLTSGAASVNTFNQSFVAPHCFVNETTSVSHDQIANTAASNLRSQAAGLLRQAALAVGSLQGVAKLHEGQEYLQSVFPVENRRFVFLVDGSIIFGTSKARTAAFDLTLRGVGDILKKGGNVILAPYLAKFITVNGIRRKNPEFVAWKKSLGTTVESGDAEQKKQLKLFAEYLAEYGVKEVGVFDGKSGPIQHSTTRSSCLNIAFSNDQSIQEKLIDSCDIFVRDTTFFGKSVDQEGPGEMLLVRARSTFGHIAIGYAAAALNVDLTPSSPIMLGAPVGNIVINSLFAVQGGFNRAAYPSASSVSTTDMRKPIDGGEGSLLSNVVSSVATTVLLHPLQLYIYPVPNPRQLPLGMGFLSLRCLHAIARDLLFHVFTKRQSGGRNQLPGWMAGIASGMLAEPVRATAYGAGANPVNSVLCTLGDPITLVNSVIMNSAPSTSFELASFLNKNLRRYVKGKVQLGLILNAISRIVMCLVLHRVVVMRRGYPNSFMKTDAKNVLGAYMLKEVCALLIETFVQRYFR